MLELEKAKNILNKYKKLEKKNENNKEVTPIEEIYNYLKENFMVLENCLTSENKIEIENSIFNAESDIYNFEEKKLTCIQKVISTMLGIIDGKIDYLNGQIEIETRLGNKKIIEDYENNIKILIHHRNFVIKEFEKLTFDINGYTNYINELNNIYKTLPSYDSFKNLFDPNSSLELIYYSNLIMNYMYGYNKSEDIEANLMVIVFKILLEDHYNIKIKLNSDKQTVRTLMKNVK